jgi:hypothetical protein
VPAVRWCFPGAYSGDDLYNGSTAGLVVQLNPNLTGDRLRFSWSTQGGSRQSGDAPDPLPYFQRDSCGTPHGFPQNGDFSDAFRDAPNTGSPGWEESQIAGAQSPFFTFLVGYEDLTGDYHDGLVLAVLAGEAPGRALPYNNVRGQVVASQDVPGPRHRGAT